MEKEYVEQRQLALRVERPHSLDLETVKVRLWMMMLKLEEGGNYEPISKEWVGNILKVSFRVKFAQAIGYTFSGEAEVSPSSVIITSDLPLVALPFRRRIVDEISNGLDDILKP